MNQSQDVISKLHHSVERKACVAEITAISISFAETLRNGFMLFAIHFRRGDRVWQVGWVLSFVHDFYLTCCDD